MVRDITLAASGLLSPKIGGPSVFPYKPPGLWDRPYSKAKWVTSEGEDRYRRGIYTFLRRTSPYPNLSIFDAPSREFCTVRRVRTNTPLQKLTALNDPAFLRRGAGSGVKDLLDCKPKPQQLDGQARRTFSRESASYFIVGKPKLLGSPYTFKRWGKSGAEISEVLPHLV